MDLQIQILLPLSFHRNAEIISKVAKPFVWKNFQQSALGFVFRKICTSSMFYFAQKQDFLSLPGCIIVYQFEKIVNFFLDMTGGVENSVHPVEHLIDRIDEHVVNYRQVFCTTIIYLCILYLVISNNNGEYKFLQHVQKTHLVFNRKRSWNCKWAINVSFYRKCNKPKSSRRYFRIDINTQNSDKSRRQL